MPNLFPSNITLVFLSCLVLALGLITSCEKDPVDPLRDALSSQHPAITKVMNERPRDFELQIMFTEIDSSTNGSVQFNDYSYALNAHQYFYPASTVKLPSAILALEHLQSFPEIDVNTIYTIDRDSLEHSINDDIRQIFAVSDNEAYNRLYEFMGRDYINKRLKEKGIIPTQISHRLSTPNSTKDEHLPLQFISNGDKISVGASMSTKPSALAMAGLQKGTGYMKNDSLVLQPMDFSMKNYVPLAVQHGLMKRLFFTSEYDEGQQFHLSEEHKKLLLHHMRALPRNNGYDETTYYDGYGKFFMYGDTQDRIPDHIKIYNKVGYAYGTLTETAYIEDSLNNIQFLLSATILVNKNGIFNDDTYEFDSIGIPFLAQLGRELYQQKLNERYSY